MSYFYKFFTWAVLIFTALFGTFLTGFLTGAMTMSWLDETTSKSKKTTEPTFS